MQRSKRRHVTRTTKEGAHVSSFIKSALAEPDTSCVRPGTSGAFPPSEGRQGKRKMKLTRKGNPHVKKKLKLGALYVICTFNICMRIELSRTVFEKIHLGQSIMHTCT